MKIFIYKHFWNIKFVSPFDNVLYTPQKNQTYGVSSNKTKTIYLASDLKGSQLYKVLAHELTHAFCFEYKINLTLAQEEWLADFISKYGKSIIIKSDNLFKAIKNRHIL